MSLAVNPLHIGPQLDLRRPALGGFAALLLLLALFGGWAGFSHISGAVIASGEVVVKGRAQMVQSLDGGVVREILVSDGDRVTEGQVLLRLDPTLLNTNLGIARGKLAAALALRARLEAEQAGRDRIDFTYPDLPFAAPDTATDEDGQQHIFEARRAVREGSRDRLTERLAQFDNQVDGIGGQIGALSEQIELVSRDIDAQKDLAAQGLTRQSQINDLMRRRAELEGQLASLQAQRAGIANARQDAELETLQSERSFMEQVVTDLRQVNTDIEALVLEIVTRSAELERTEIRAPSEGIVNELAVTTVGGVARPGETLLQVVPTDRGMDFELKLDPRAVDQVHPGQKARLMITSFDPQSVPKLEAEVKTISAGALTDSRSGRSYYRVELSVPPGELTKLGDNELVPGMPVEAFLETADRSVLAYLLQPIGNHLRHAFRD